MDLDLPDDTRAWIEAKARQLKKPVPFTIAWLLREAQALDEHRYTLRFHPQPPHDPSDRWQDLAAEARMKADGR
jgi:hypothetical protein